MSVLVTAQRRAHAGHEEDVVAAARRWYAATAKSGRLRREARLFQSLADPADFLELARWASTTTFDSTLSAVDQGSADSLFADSPRLASWDELASFDNMGRRTNVGGCAIIDAAVERLASLRPCLLDRLVSIRLRHPELVAHALAEEQQATGRFLITFGWSSHAALERFSQELLPSLVQKLKADFGATYWSFVGIVRASFQSDTPR